MARPLRILVADGWNHVFARGNHRNRLFLDDQDPQRFPALVSELLIVLYSSPRVRRTTVPLHGAPKVMTSETVRTTPLLYF